MTYRIKRKGRILIWIFRIVFVPVEIEAIVGLLAMVTSLKSV
jgi:hypothetical protein